MSLFVPGPWTIGEGDRERPFYVHAKMAPIGKRLPATCDTKSNALLVAAAPDLYRECVQILKNGKVNTEGLMAAVRKANGGA